MSQKIKLSLNQQSPEAAKESLDASELVIQGNFSRGPFRLHRCHWLTGIHLSLKWMEGLRENRQDEFYFSNKERAQEKELGLDFRQTSREPERDTLCFAHGGVLLMELLIAEGLSSLCNLVHNYDQTRKRCKHSQGFLDYFFSKMKGKENVAVFKN